MYDFPESVESIDAVPQDFQSLYAEQDGKFTVPEALRPAVNAFKNVTATLAKSRKEADDYKKKVVDLSPLSDFGQTPEEIKAAFDAKIAEGSKAKIDVDKIKQEVAQKFANDHKALETRNQALTKQLYAMNVRNVATEALTQEEGSIELLMPHIERHVQQVEEDGQLKAYVVDADNSRRYSSTTGEPMTIREFVAELKSNETFKPAFKSKTKSGGGTPPGAASRTTPQRQSGDMNPTQKIAAGLEALRK